MKIFKLILLVCCVLLLQDCAQISAPTGGEVDTQPPTLDSLNTVPSNYSTNFSSNTITIAFDEYFVLKNPKTNVLFSPSLENDPEFITKGKILTILIKDTLKPETTYTINFGDAISDYTVGNKIPDFKYVFSTGSFIDSMSTSGIVIDAFTGKPLEDALVMLYDDFTDSVVSKSKPIYYTKTNKQGAFNITYIKADYYKIIALKDENRNYKYDLPNEKIGFGDSPLNLADTNSQSSISLSVFERDHLKQKVKSKKYYYPGKLVLTFIKPVDSTTIQLADSSTLTYHSLELSKKRDSLIIWKPGIKLEKTQLIVSMDTVKEKISLYPFTFPKAKIGLKQSKIIRSIDKGSPFNIVFERPISSFIDSSITLYEDSIKIPIDSVKIDNQILSIYFENKEDKSYKYQLNSGSVTDIFSLKLTDTLSGYVTVRKSDYYGSFTLNFKPNNDSCSYLLFLLDEQGKLIEKKITTGNSTVSFLKLAPAKYTIKAIKDLNNNGKWDTGDYYKKLKPESISFFPSSIEIRSNWEMAETWHLN